MSEVITSAGKADPFNEGEDRPDWNFSNAPMIYETEDSFPYSITLQGWSGDYKTVIYSESGLEELSPLVFAVMASTISSVRSSK